MQVVPATKIIRFQNIEALLSQLEGSLKNNAAVTELSEHSKALAEHLQRVRLPEISTKERID